MTSFPGILACTRPENTMQAPKGGEKVGVLPSDNDQKDKIHINEGQHAAIRCGWQPTSEVYWT